MSDIDFSKATPRPWRAVGYEVVDANGAYVCNAGDAECAALIVAAVNGYDQMRAAMQSFSYAMTLPEGDPLREPALKDAHRKARAALTQENRP